MLPVRADASKTDYEGVFMRIPTGGLDLSLAIKRVTRDIRDDWFVDPLRYSDILTKRRFDRWLEDADGFGQTEDFNVPKEGFVVRSASDIPATWTTFTSFVMMCTRRENPYRI